MPPSFDKELYQQAKTSQVAYPKFAF